MAQELSKIFRGPVIAAGGFNPDTAEASVAHGDASLIAFGRHFIANPDLPKRIELGLAVEPVRSQHLLWLRCAGLYRLSRLRGACTRSAPHS
ncbi:MAG TPA: hypothetical protein VK148_23900 [Xanthobacteraceae bacterium]|nr:hypothetical protein [Xanthobacteraceae bacterium]